MNYDVIYYRRDESVYCYFNEHGTCFRNAPAFYLTAASVTKTAPFFYIFFFFYHRYYKLEYNSVIVEKASGVMVIVKFALFSSLTSFGVMNLGTYYRIVGRVHIILLCSDVYIISNILFYQSQNTRLEVANGKYNFAYFYRTKKRCPLIVFPVYQTAIVIRKTTFFNNIFFFFYPHIL